MENREKEDYKIHYLLGENIHKGIYSTIFKGIDKKSNECRAIKIININLIKDELLKKCNSSDIDKILQSYIDILIMKFKNLKECSKNNNNSVKYYEYFINNNEFIIIMELCDDNVLNILNKIKKGLNSKEIYKIMRQFNSTIRIISKKNIILKGLELENILIKYTDNNCTNFILKLSNYGTPSIKDKKYDEILSKFFPEKYEEQKKYENNKYDLLNIGIIIYRLFFIEKPNKENNEYEIKKIKKTGDKFLDDLIKHLLINDSEKRLNWEQYFAHPFFNKGYIEITYKINPNENKIKLFGEQFIINNENIKNQISIIFENKPYNFDQYLELKNINCSYKDTLTIKLTGVDELVDVSHMFDSCESLLSVSQIKNWDSSQITNMKCMFNRCRNLISLPDIHLLNTSQVKYMNFLFSRCKSLTSLPDISKWDTSNVQDMSYMFYSCKSLKSIADLSKWNASNVIKISNIFFKCKLLSSKPVIHYKEKRCPFRSDLKIIVIGSYNTNKTQFVNRYTKNVFNDTYKATIVSEFGFKIVEYGDSLFRIQLWDLAGQDSNAMVTKIFAKDAHGAVIMSNACDIKTRDDTIKWKYSLDEVAKFQDGKELPCVLVENNIDLLCDDDHYDPSFEYFWKNNGYVKGFRVSAKTGENVNESMEYLIKKIIKRLEIIAEKAIEVDNDETSTPKSPKGNTISFESKDNDKKLEKKDKCILF